MFLVKMRFIITLISAGLDIGLTAHRSGLQIRAVDFTEYLYTRLGIINTITITPTVKINARNISVNSTTHRTSVSLLFLNNSSNKYFKGEAIVTFKKDITFDIFNSAITFVYEICSIVGINSGKAYAF